MKQSPAFQFYPADFVASPKVAVMTVDEVGAYCLLLFLDWQGGGFAYDEERLAKWCKMTAVEFALAWDGVLRKCFVERDGRWWNPRLEREREKQAAWRAKSAQGGKSSAAKRWGVSGNQTVTTPISKPQAKGNQTVKQKGNQSGNQSGNQTVTLLSSVSCLKEKETTTARFEELWAAYPKRSGSSAKALAEKQVAARLAEGVPFELLLSKTQEYKAWCDATEKTGTERVMQAARFYGASHEFRLGDWSVPLVARKQHEDIARGYVSA